MEKRIDLANLAVWHHLPEGPPKAHCLIIHGLGEHSGRHLNTVRFLQQRQYSVIRFDLRGAGESGGRRQWIERFEDYVEDTNQVFNTIHRTLSPAPIFMLGHSLGGAIAIYFASLRSRALQGLVLSAPAYQIGEKTSKVKIKIGRWLRGVAPKLVIPGSIDHSSVSRDPKVVETYTHDPLACHFNTVRQGNEILDALPKMPKMVASILCPTLIVHGGADTTVRVEGSFELLRLLKPEKTLYVNPGGYHETHNDWGKEDYFQALDRWLQAHLTHPYSIF